MKSINQLTETKFTPRDPDPVQLVTPYLPPMAIALIRDHERMMKQPAFVLAMQRTPGMCPNCGGIGAVYVRICKGGPYQAPAGLSSVVTWFDGDGQFGKGWYVVDATKSWDCPECMGKR